MNAAHEPVGERKRTEGALSTTPILDTFRHRRLLQGHAITTKKLSR